MGFNAMELLGLLMRWCHVASAAMLVGGMGYARVVTAPAIAALPEDERAESWAILTVRFRPLVYAALAGLFVSGLYNFTTHPGHSRFYLAWFGIKMLLAAHIFAAAFLSVRGAYDAKHARRMAGVIVSGLLVILLSAYLQRIF